MMDSKYTLLTKRTYKEVIVTEWCKIKAFDAKAVTIRSELLGLSLNIFYGSGEVFDSYIKSEYKESLKHVGWESLFIHYIAEDGKDWYWINIKDNNWLAKDYGLIAHELHHFVHVALVKKGIDYNDSSEEVFAYTLGYFMEMVIRSLLELNNILKPVRKK